MILKRKISNIVNEFRSFSRKEKLFFLSVMLCAFLICADYASIRSISSSLFLSSYSSKDLPLVWGALAPLSFLATFAYNRYLQKIGYLKMFVTIILSVIGVNLSFIFFLKNFISSSFLFYLWREIYIMIMLQQLWSMVQSTIPEKRAKYFYGILMGVGGLGGIGGSLVPGFLAVHFGSENLIFFTLPIYAFLLLFFYLSVKYGGVVEPSLNQKKIHSITYPMKFIGASRVLKFILVAVVFMQVITTLVEYQFNSFVESAISDQDLRTQYCGRVFGVVNFVAMTLQFIGGFLIVHFLGLRGSHFLIPSVIGVNMATFALFPIFNVITSAHVAVKSIGYSLFGVILKMLYIPLSQEEKFHAKSFIDVFVYRSSKSVCSVVIFLLKPLGNAIIPILTWVSLSILLAWLFLVSWMFRGKRIFTS